MEWVTKSTEDWRVDDPRPWTDEDDLGFSVRLHPAADTISVSVSPSGSVRLQAPQTSGIGPGYHSAVIDLFRNLADDCHVGLSRTDDPTGFWTTGSWDKLCEAFTTDRRALARFALDQGPGHLMAWNFSTERVFQVLPGELVHTWLGPLTGDEVDRVIIDDAVLATTLPWWAGGRDGEYHRRRALCWLWVRCRWRRSDTWEAAELVRAMGDLHAAADAGAEPLPWREWHEIHLLHNTTGPEVDEIAERAADQAPGNPIGYRRRNMTVEVLRPWSVIVPGPFLDQWVDDGEWFRAADGTEVVRVRIVERPSGPPAPPPPDAIHQISDRLDRWATITPTADGGVTLAGSVRDRSSAQEANVVVVAVEHGEDWAVAVWQSVRCR